MVSTCVAIAVLGLAAGGCDRTPDSALLPRGAADIHRAAAGAPVERSLQQELARGEGAVDRRGPHGWTPLHFAAIYNREGAARTLLKAHCQVDPIDHAGMTPLHWAARRGYLPIVRLLLAHRAQVSARNKLNMTPLHEARTPQIAALLLAHGADLNARDIDGMTPLHRAQTKQVAQYLIDEQKASVHAQARDGRTPMSMPPLVRPRVE